LEVTKVFVRALRRADWTAWLPFSEVLEQKEKEVQEEEEGN
jgi:hypothetical protein